MRSSVAWEECCLGFIEMYKKANTIRCAGHASMLACDRSAPLKLPGYLTIGGANGCPELGEIQGIASRHQIDMICNDTDFAD